MAMMKVLRSERREAMQFYLQKGATEISDRYEWTEEDQPILNRLRARIQAKSKKREALAAKFPKSALKKQKEGIKLKHAEAKCDSKTADSYLYGLKRWFG